jgi:DUF4097 and DUF4098 domain-containing protein YvlB
MNTMRQLRYGLLGLAIAAASASLGAQTEEMRVPFSDPSKPGRVEINIMNGKIRVEGYDGRDVVVLTSSQEGKGLLKPRARRESRPEREGLRRIGPSAASVDIEEQGNVLRLRSSAFEGMLDITVRVPTDSAVKVKCLLCDNLVANNVSGGLELENLNGNIQATDISGAVSAHSLNNKVVVKMRRVEPDKVLALTSMNGEVDVTLPADTKADIHVDNLNGETFTDFDLKLQPAKPTDTSEERTSGGGYKAKVHLNRNLRAQLNGGGATIRLKNINGDILIRKGQ